MTADGTAKRAGGMKRPWYHLHVVTCVAMVLVASALDIPTDVPRPDLGDSWVVYGWPLTCNANDAGKLAIACAVNSVVAILLLSGTAMFFEQWLRNEKTRFSLKTGFTITATVAVMIAFIKWDKSWDISNYWEIELKYSILLSNPDEASWPRYVPIFGSVSCTIYIALLLATRLAGWCFTSVSRRFRRSSAA